MLRADVAINTANSSQAETLRLLRLAPAAEANCGNIEASRVTSRVVASIPEHESEIIQISYAVEAIEKEDYRSWPSQWVISGLRKCLVTDITELCLDNGITRFQRKRYRELQDHPRLLRSITHGFTRKLRISDKKGFISELISVGRRECSRGDEVSALDETDVVHIALSYKHADHFSQGGTIDYKTAEEAYEIILTIPSYSHVRVWIDQNLHRYPRNGPWYERGFLPFTVMYVVSALGRHGGFGIARRRPWIWLDTGMALNSLGIHCREDVSSTIEEVIVYPQSSLVPKAIFESIGTIPGTGMSVFDSVSQVLRSASWWTQDMLSHKDYEYVSSFREFVQWAKAKVVRLEKKRALDFSGDMFEDTILENICWMRALPADTSMRQSFQSPYLRLELDARKARKKLALLQVSGKCQNVDGVYELVGKYTGLKTFCFTVSSNVLCVNVNPSQRPTALRVSDATGSKEGVADLEAMKASRGGYSLWDRRFPSYELPRFIYCGTIFGRHLDMRHRLGEEASDITLGGFSFTREGFISVGFHAEGVYVSRSGNEVYLCESDVLCIRELPEDLQKELIMALSPEEALPSMARILKAESDITNAHLSPRTIGTTTADIELGIRKIKAEDVHIDDINILRVRLDEYLHSLLISDNRFGKLVYTFQTSVALEPSQGDLLHFKMEGDIDMTLSKIRLMMGSDEFSGYAEDGLSLGIGVYNGTEKYPHEFRLEGSEFMICNKCNTIYSPINMMMCVLSSDLRTKKIKPRWGYVHYCSAEGRSCHIIGRVE